MTGIHSKMFSCAFGNDLISENVSIWKFNEFIALGLWGAEINVPLFKHAIKVNTFFVICNIYKVATNRGWNSGAQTI